MRALGRPWRDLHHSPNDILLLRASLVGKALGAAFGRVEQPPPLRIQITKLSKVTNACTSLFRYRQQIPHGAESPTTSFRMHCDDNRHMKPNVLVRMYRQSITEYIQVWCWICFKKCLRPHVVPCDNVFARYRIRRTPKENSQRKWDTNARPGSSNETQDNSRVNNGLVLI